jgi:hypothetical protein
VAGKGSKGQVRRPRIYGSEAKCRTALARYIDQAEELLDQAEGVGRRVEAATRAGAHLDALLIEEGWEKPVRRWFVTAQRGMGPFLQDEFVVVAPTLAWGLPPDTGKPRHRIALDNGVPWLRQAVKELRDLQAALGVRRDVAAASPAPARFEELHASGLVGKKVIEDRAKEMRVPKTPGQVAKGIGSAKDLTEATLRAALDRLGESYSKSNDLPLLMKKWRAAVSQLAPPDPVGEKVLDQAQAALANLVKFLAEWRNAYGSGHGHPQYPPGLRPRHARLAAEALRSVRQNRPENGLVTPIWGQNVVTGVVTTPAERGELA